jgi:hypothetical protein
MPSRNVVADVLFFVGPAFQTGGLDVGGAEVSAVASACWRSRGLTNNGTASVPFSPPSPDRFADQVNETAFPHVALAGPGRRRLSAGRVPLWAWSAGTFDLAVKYERRLVADDGERACSGHVRVWRGIQGWPRIRRGFLQS